VTGIIINGIDIGNLMAYGLPPRGNPFTKFWLLALENFLGENW
jgi:hypothetical protein